MAKKKINYGKTDLLRDGRVFRDHFVTNWNYVSMA